MTNERERKRKGVQLALAAEESFEPTILWWRRFFAPDNRPFIYYLLVLAALGGVFAYFWYSPYQARMLAILSASPTDYLERYLNEQFSQRRLPSAEFFWAVELWMVAVFWWLTRPMDLQPYRWTKIGISAVLVYLLLMGANAPLNTTFQGRGGNVLMFLGWLLPAMLFTLMWLPVLVWHLARFFTEMVDPAYDYKLTPELRPAYRAVHNGEPREALKRAKEVLHEDFHHYEASILVARVQRYLGREWRARLALHRALRNPRLMDGQRERIVKMLREMDDGLHDGWVLAGRLK